MKRKQFLTLFMTIMVCSIVFVGCVAEENDETKKLVETNSESTSENNSSESIQKTEENNSENASKNENSEKKDDADDAKNTLSDLKNQLKEKADKIINNVKGENDSDKVEDNKYHPGDIVTFGDFKITYKSIKKYESDNEFIQPKEGFKYIKYVFSFKNVGKSDSYVGDFSCYADGEKCDSAYVDDTDSDLLLLELSPGRKKSGSLVFEVPNKVKLKNLELEYENYSLWSDKKIIFLGK